MKEFAHHSKQSQFKRAMENSTDEGKHSAEEKHSTYKGKHSVEGNHSTDKGTVTMYPQY
jgi:hypothetical protein